jgi:exocyst complex component 6
LRLTFLWALPLSADVKKINPNGVAALAKDVGYLAEFVDSLENAPILRENLDELQQTVNLMQTDNPDEFFDVATRNKKFGRVDALNGPKILEKYNSSSFTRCYQCTADNLIGSHILCKAMQGMTA